MQLTKSLAVLAAVLSVAVSAAPSASVDSDAVNATAALEAQLLEARELGARAASAGLPSQDFFYRPGFGYQAKPNGSILKSRQVKPASGRAATAYQLLYRTTDAIGNADATVVTILVPKSPKSPPKIIGIQLPEDSVSLDCAPSAALVSGTGSPAAAGLAFTNQGVDSSLENGYYVVIPDHEGPKAASFVGPTEGRAVLDGLKAATSFSEGIPGVSKSTPIAIGGYSGGAHATAWASQLYNEYGDGLNIKGQVIGGTPVDLTNTLNFLNKGTYAGFAFVGIVGEYLAYPDIRSYIDRYITSTGRSKVNKLINDKQCLLNVVLGYGGTDVYKYFTKDNPLEDPVPKKRLAENLLGGDGKKLPYGTIMYHGTKDDIIPYEDAVKYAKSQCAKGARVHFNPSPGKQHIPEELGSNEKFTRWLSQVVEGRADFSCNVAFL